MTSTAFAEPGKPLREIALQKPDLESGPTLVKTLAARRSIRDFSPQALTPAELSQLLWAGQGITNRSGFRTAPSAGALYPIELYLTVGRVEGVSPGLFRYQPSKHLLLPVEPGDRRAPLSRAALSQTWIRDAAVVIAVAAVARRTTRKYGERGRRYVFMEAGHVAQNVCLQATSLGLGATPVGAFDDEEVKHVLRLAREAEPLYLLPVGRP